MAVDKANLTSFYCASALPSRSRHNTCCNSSWTSNWLGTGHEWWRYCRLLLMESKKDWYNQVRVSWNLAQAGEPWFIALRRGDGGEVDAVFCSRTFKEGGRRIIFELGSIWHLMSMGEKWGCCLKPNRTCFENGIYACLWSTVECLPRNFTLFLPWRVYLCARAR